MKTFISEYGAPTHTNYDNYQMKISNTFYR